MVSLSIWLKLENKFRFTMFLVEVGSKFWFLVEAGFPELKVVGKFGLT